MAEMPVGPDALPGPPRDGVGFSVRRATAADATAVASLIRDAFATEVPTYGSDLPPLAETPQIVADALGRGVVRVAEEGDRILGSVRGELAEDGSCLVGRLVVLPEARRAGIARALAVEIERQFPDATRFELFTGHLSTAALALYESLGYQRFREERVSPTTVLVYLEKLQECS